MPRISAKQSFGSVPPKFGSTVGFVPVVLGLAHQAGAIAVFGVALYHFWLARSDSFAAVKAQAAASA